MRIGHFIFEKNYIFTKGSIILFMVSEVDIIGSIYRYRVTILFCGG